MPQVPQCPGTSRSPTAAHAPSGSCTSLSPATCLTNAWAVSILAGATGTAGAPLPSCTGAACRFSFWTWGVATLPSVSLAIANTEYNVLQLLSAGGGVRVLAGSAVNARVDGPALSGASFSQPKGLAADALGALAV